MISLILLIGLDLPPPAVEPITDQQIVAAAKGPFNRDDIARGGRTLGTNRGMLVIEDLLCQDRQCGSHVTRVIRY